MFLQNIKNHLRRITVSHPRRLESLSPILVSPGRWRNFDPSKQQELITQYHNITSQEDFILKSHMNHRLCNCFNHFSANNLYALLQILNQPGRTWCFIFRVLGSNRSSKTIIMTECSVCRHMWGQHFWDAADDGCLINWATHTTAYLCVFLSWLSLCWWCKRGMTDTKVPPLQSCDPACGPSRHSPVVVLHTKYIQCACNTPYRIVHEKILNYVLETTTVTPPDRQSHR